MVPSSFIGLLLFVVLLAPGLCFFLAWEVRRPRRDSSILRESGLVVLTSLGIGVVVAGLFGLGRIAAPRHTPDVAVLVSSSGGDYLRGHLAYMLTWFTGLIVLSCAAGWGLGQWGARQALERRTLGGIRYVSAWFAMFYETQRELFDDCFVYLGCYLDDGTWVGGTLKNFNTDIDEAGDRDLVLLPPVTRRALDGSGELREVSGVVVSARRVVQLEFSFVPWVLPAK